MKNFIINTINYLYYYNKIFIPFFGDPNVDKSTIINGIIGEEILPTSLGECTKKGIIIRYCNRNEEEITIRKAKLKEINCFEKSLYFFNLSKEIIVKDKKQVIDVLNGLNYIFADEEEDLFYNIRTKIKLFDEIGLSNNLKSIIYLVDFPGYSTDNIFVKNNIYEKVLSFCNSFMFIVRNSRFKEQETKKILNLIVNLIKNEKKNSYSGILKSCAFIMNNDNSQSTEDEVLKQAKNGIQCLIDYNGDKEEDSKEEKKFIKNDKINLYFFDEIIFKVL